MPSLSLAPRPLPALCLATFLVPPSVRADPILQEGFESPAWHAGQVLHPGTTVNGWTNSSSDAFVHVSTLHPDSGTQSLHVRFLGLPPAPGAVDTFGQIDRAISYTPAAQGIRPDPARPGPGRPRGGRTAAAEARAESGIARMTVNRFDHANPSHDPRPGFGAPGKMGKDPSCYLALYPVVTAYLKSRAKA